MFSHVRDMRLKVDEASKNIRELHWSLLTQFPFSSTLWSVVTHDDVFRRSVPWIRSSWVPIKKERQRVAWRSGNSKSANKWMDAVYKRRMFTVRPTHNECISYVWRTSLFSMLNNTSHSVLQSESAFIGETPNGCYFQAHPLHPPCGFGRRLSSCCCWCLVQLHAIESGFSGWHALHFFANQIMKEVIASHRLLILSSLASSLFFVVSQSLTSVVLVSGFRVTRSRILMASQLSYWQRHNIACFQFLAPLILLQSRDWF